MKVRNTEFYSKSDYMAGLRDSGRIELLTQQTDLSDPAAAAALYRELKNQPFYFETEVGKDFIKELLHKTRPSDRGVGVGIRRVGYRTTKEEEERIRAYEESRRARRTDSIRIIENDSDDYERFRSVLSELEYEARNGKSGKAKKHRRLFGKKNSASRAAQSTTTSKTEKKETKQSEAKRIRTRREQRRTLLFLTGVLSALVLTYCVTDEASYRIQSFASERKMSALQSEVQNGVLQPMDIAKDDEPIMERIAMAGDGVVLASAMKEDGLDANEAPDATESGAGDILPEYEMLYEKNSSMIGWLRIPDTKINYPVMQTKDDMEYYLYRDFDGEDDVNGLPFLDARCDIYKPTTNLLIYGHSMKNGAMFAGLSEYKDQAYYEKHSKVYFDTIHEHGTYEIVAVFQSRVAYVDEIAFRYYNFIQADTEEEFNSFMSAVKQLSYYDTGKEVRFGDRLLTLSTCDREIMDGRLVVLARRIVEE